MLRYASISSTLLLPLAALAATVGQAAARQIHFRADPANPPAEARLVVRDTVFRCGVSGCVAPRASSRPELVCAALAREVGELRSFSSAGRSFDAAALAACNSRAR